jgi:hypothetical protein
MDRKPKFRSRKLEHNRPLQIFRYDDTVDIDDYDNHMRSAPMIETGVDKEEEEVIIAAFLDFLTFHRSTICKLP